MCAHYNRVVYYIKFAMAAYGWKLLAYRNGLRGMASTMCNTWLVVFMYMYVYSQRACIYCVHVHVHVHVPTVYTYTCMYECMTEKTECTSATLCLCIEYGQQYMYMYVNGTSKTHERYMHRKNLHVQRPFEQHFDLSVSSYCTRLSRIAMYTAHLHNYYTLYMYIPC